MATLTPARNCWPRSEQERATLLELLPRFSDEQWRTAARDDGWTAHDIATHLADANYGLALMALGECLRR